MNLFKIRTKILWSYGLDHLKFSVAHVEDQTQILATLLFIGDRIIARIKKNELREQLHEAGEPAILPRVFRFPIALRGNLTEDLVNEPESGFCILLQDGKRRRGGVRHRGIVAPAFRRG